MNHVLTDLTRDGPYCRVGVFQRVGVGRHQIQWEPVRGKLLERQLTRPVPVATRALKRDVLNSGLTDREVRELGQLAL